MTKYMVYMPSIAVLNIDIRSLMRGALTVMERKSYSNWMIEAYMQVVGIGASGITAQWVISDELMFVVRDSD